MRRIGVYKTDVDKQPAAKIILEAIFRSCPDCDASFDLEDCDNVLRVDSLQGEINESKLRKILQNHGYQIEKLP